ncbi:MAG: hypothetical protein H7A40_07515 [Chlamydiales bacterium]|nr:hypothetical protein [Chlamydiales bacterium]
MATISVTHTCLDNTTKYTRQDEMLLLNKLGARSFVSLDQRSQLILAHIYYRAERGEAKAKSLANRCTELETLNGELAKKNAALEAEKAALGEEKAALGEEKAALEAKNAALKVEKMAMRDERDEARIKNDGLRGRLQGKDFEIDALKGENRTLSAAMDDLAKRIDNLEKGISNRPGSYTHQSSLPICSKKGAGVILCAVALGAAVGKFL